MSVSSQSTLKSAREAMRAEKAARRARAEAKVKSARAETDLRAEARTFVASWKVERDEARQRVRKLTGICLSR